jgi:predicted dehydrogenase
MTKLRVAVCGSGNRSRVAWQKYVNELDGFELVGVQDISEESLDKAEELENIGPGQRYKDLERMLSETKPDALLALPINEVHVEAIEAGLNAGCHVLVEKPFTTDLSEGVRLARLADKKELKLNVVQNWRCKSVGQRLKKAVSEGLIGEVSHIFFRYLRDREMPHLPDYLFDEEDPLLYSNTIHQLDLFRYILDQEITSVEGKCFLPSWSRYKHPSCVQLWMTTKDGVVISYLGTLSSRNGHLPIENLLVEGEEGTLFNESIYSEPPLWLTKRGGDSMVDLTEDITVRDMPGQYKIGDMAVLENFHATITAGEPPLAPAWDNLGTLAVLEAARLSLEEERAVNPQELLSAATSSAKSS